LFLQTRPGHSKIFSKLHLYSLSATKVLGSNYINIFEYPPFKEHRRASDLRSEKGSWINTTSWTCRPSFAKTRAFAFRDLLLCNGLGLTHNFRRLQKQFVSEIYLCIEILKVLQSSFEIEICIYFFCEI